LHISSQESKYGLALVIETTKRSGGLLLGFRIDPVSKVNETRDKLQKLWRAYHHNPDYGVQVVHQETKVKICYNEDLI
jgi:Bardet-Biedl syndrome 5 protein